MVNIINNFHGNLKSCIQAILINLTSDQQQHYFKYE